MDGMDHLPEAARKLVLEYTAKSMLRMILYTQAEQDAYIAGTEDFSDFASKLNDVLMDTGGEENVNQMTEFEFMAFLSSKLKGL